MTFKEFQASRKHVDDIAAALGEQGMFGDDPQPGFVYSEGGKAVWYIHDEDDCCRRGGDHWTEIENKMVEGTLEQVERRLYLFAARQSPEWLDDDFTVIYPVTLDGEQVGVMRCCIDGGIRPNGLSDDLPEWISDFWLDNLEHCPDDVESMGYGFDDPYFMP